MAAAAAVLAVAGLAGWWFGASPAPPPPLRVVETAAQPALTVHVAGAVARPGLVTVEPGARVADVIALAGGLSGEADAASLNLAAPVVDGQQIMVRRAGSVAVPAESGLVPVNTADVSQLETISGVGPVLAARIVAYRLEHGPFVVMEDLLDVPGIGEAKLAAMRDSLAVP